MEIRPAEMSGNLDLMPDTWYNILLALGKNGDMKVLVWDPTKPTSTLQYWEQMGEQWTALPWILEIGVNKGKVLIDDWLELSFSGIK